MPCICGAPKDRNNERQPLGDIVLIGVTGYLDIHILHEFIENRAGKVYCLICGKKDLSAALRAKSRKAPFQPKGRFISGKVLQVFL